jgi:uncharacterized protein YkwD
MIKRVFIVTMLLTLMLSACNPQAATEPAVPTSTATETQAPTATESPISETPAVTEISPPVATATAETPRPTNDPNCTNSAAFVSDVTIPDNTTLGAGTPFTKTWRVSNTGTCIWGPDYTLTHYSDELMNAPASVPLAVTYPGQTADISVNLTAPNSTGSHRANFVIKNPAGLIMKVNEDSRLWLIINVTTDTTNATAVSGSGAGLVTATCAFSAEPAVITETINAINAYRTENGLPAYTTNSLLAKAAQAHANDMACNNLAGHTGSNGSTIQSRVTDSGYVFSTTTENVQFSYPPLTGQGVVNWWKNDKTDLRHNLNLISDTYVDVGVGYSFFNNYGYYVVVFGTP